MTSRPVKETPRRRVGWALLLVLGLLVLTLDGVVTASRPDPIVFNITRAIGGGRPRVQRAAMARLAQAARVSAIAGPSVVHVWLQGCADCAPAFEAARRLHVQGATFGATVFNVSAFNQADPAFAAEHGIDQHLITDPGESFVRPLNIGTFTTVVLDAQGNVRHTDYPQVDGYLDRVRTAVTTAATPLGPDVEAESFPLAPTLSTAPSSSPVFTALGAALALAGLGWGALLVPWAAWMRRARPAPPLPTRVLGQEVGLQPQQRCPYCHADLTGWDWVVRCEGCSTVYHEECANDLSKCTSIGCARRVSSRRARER